MRWTFKWKLVSSTLCICFIHLVLTFEVMWWDSENLWRSYRSYDALSSVFVLGHLTFKIAGKRNFAVCVFINWCLTRIGSSRTSLSFSKNGRAPSWGGLKEKKKVFSSLHKKRPCKTFRTFCKKVHVGQGCITAFVCEIELANATCFECGAYRYDGKER